MQWDNGRSGGFTTGRPWLPVADDAGRLNVASARSDRQSTLALYHDLLALRRAEPALTRGAFRLLPRQGDVLAYLREAPASGGRRGNRFLVIVNFAPIATAYVEARTRITDGGRRRATVAVSTFSRPGAVEVHSIALSPNEAVVLRLAPTP